MSSIWGKNIEVSIFGESHGKAVGVTLNGIPSGIELDIDFLNREMQRRSPGKNELSTKRREKDQFEIISGYFNNRTTGTPLCAIIQNSDIKSADYGILKSVMRPGHADLTGRIKYNGFNDYRGGGHFSGRLTAPLVFAGAVAKQILKRKNINFVSHIKSIENIHDKYFNFTDISAELTKKLINSDFPTIDDDIRIKMQECILKAKEQKDSVGGIIETAILNVPCGMGSPFFNSTESTLSHLLFSIPAVKGVEFGAGFNISEMKGSQANDEMYISDNRVLTYTNNNGGIIGGITNGMPIVFRTAFKPTPSIGIEQKTVDIEKMENTMLKIKGRHDPCIVQRAIPAVEAAAALAVLDMVLERGKYDG